MSTRSKVTVETVVHAPIEKVWEYWTNPEYIKHWNAASDDWHTPSATNDLRVGGMFSSRMEARDKSVGFDFSGTYTDVVLQAHIAYSISGDGRTVEVTFEQTDDGVKVIETFEAEDENPIEMQRSGWQAIMDRFRKYVENAE